MSYHSVTAASVAQPSLFEDLPPVSGRERGEGGLGKHPLEAAVDDQQAGDKGAKHQKLSSSKWYMYKSCLRGDYEFCRYFMTCDFTSGGQELESAFSAAL